MALLEYNADKSAPKLKVIFGLVMIVIGVLHLVGIGVVTSWPLVAQLFLIWGYVCALFLAYGLLMFFEGIGESTSTKVE